MYGLKIQWQLFYKLNTHCNNNQIVFIFGHYWFIDIYWQKFGAKQVKGGYKCCGEYHPLRKRSFCSHLHCS